MDYCILIGQDGEENERSGPQNMNVDMVSKEKKTIREYYFLFAFKMHEPFLMLSSFRCRNSGQRFENH